ncbi:MAG: sulfotransferase family protein [Deltaproteobacteria bacterium]|nr:sulfotransferase family protein [Deltaproteobacteria bacterium]
MSKLKRFVRDQRYGEPVVIVSGLPRSGTSMMMKMLEAGGLSIMTDGERRADVDNPKGYFEYERVKDLEKETDTSYVQQGRGKVLKVISFLLRFLPDDNQYRVIFMRRDLDEVLASQDKMIAHRKSEDATDPEALKEQYRNDIIRARLMCRKKANFEYLEVQHRDTIERPAETADAVNVFLGGVLDEVAAAGVVDPALYRNRADQK